ncbi:hypothetical protein S1001342_03221 (plasmid) [Acetobacter pasteurianus subsp. pasteurianus]|uniref:Uncharacterized protein n=1 Tax=Acetobacter pasteurianus subsp. pasteurianus TaxID=481145 RepID=A0A1Y0Y7U5_ACEPA|nr:hypothetical protein S1001342_03221 [Acetobacter pasteurianus subsp. pasteurianus]
MNNKQNINKNNYFKKINITEGLLYVACDYSECC